jgi:NAD(P)H-dependent FMN reductase
LFAANLKNASDMLELGGQLGCDLKALVDLVLASSGSSFGLEAIARHIRPDLVAHYQAIVAKDVHYLSEAARRRGVPHSPLEEQAEQGIKQLDGALQRYLASQ